MPNPIAYLMLILWPFICLYLFRTQKLERALIWSVLGGYLFLPPLAVFDLPLVPGMDKVSIPNLTILLIILFALKKKVALWPESWIARVLFVGLVVGSIPTVLTNTDAIMFEAFSGAAPISFVTDVLPGQSVRDVGSVFLLQVLTLVPFVLARQFLATDDGLREILMALVIGSLIYTLPALIEIRLSPQMNVWIYGFFQHSFEQTMRGGGFRPLVFLPHPLWLALMMSTAVMAAAALAKTTPIVDRWKVYSAMCYLACIVVLCKSLASLAYCVALTPVVLMISVRWQIRLAATFALIAVIYPMLRNAGVIPIYEILAQIEELSPDRAQSLGFRFYHEEELLHRAAEKPLFGWGGWGRNLTHDPMTGRVLSIPDGRWIIVFGTFGWLGYVSEFGLLALPLILMGLYIRKNPQAVLSPYVAPLCLILGITLMDMLLNATLTPFTWLTAGAILGYAEKLMPKKAARPKYALGDPALNGNARQDGRRTVM